MKRTIARLGALAFLLAVPLSAWARPMSGDPAPAFQAPGLDGKTYDLATMATTPMTVLYFFDATSPASQEGLLRIDDIARDYKTAGMTVWAITRSSESQARTFAEKHKPAFPVLLDGANISDQYDARLILPTVCILGPDRIVLDLLKGGGGSTAVMLTRLAERNLQRRETAVAKALSEEAAREEPAKAEALAVKAYAALEEGNLEEAEAASRSLAKLPGEGEILAREVEATVLAEKGETEAALKTAEAVERKAPERVQATRIKADILYAQNQKPAAEAAYREAAGKPEGSDYQKARAKNRYGRFFASLGDYEKARGQYDEAVEIDPYFVEATANKGVTYGREGQWDQALAAYRKTLAVDSADPFAAVLARQAEEMLALRNDASRRERVDKLVKELAERFRKQQAAPGADMGDEWTSRPMILAFVDFRETGGLSDRDGFSEVLTLGLTQRLNASGRVQVVERVLLERLLEELNLGSSDLADPETQLRLGRVLAAKLLGTGSLLHLPAGSLLTLRLIDTETTGVPKIITRQIPAEAVEREADALNRMLLRAVIEEYPLRGYVVESDGKKGILNLGERQGVVLGTRFQVLGEPKSIEYRGKTLKGSPEPLGLVEVTEVEPDFSHVRVVEGGTAVQRDRKVQEKAADASAS
ncbi:MAG: tetratricopeptide repeat protein [Thermodesulfobacteriota bacterium]